MVLPLRPPRTAASVTEDVTGPVHSAEMAPQQRDDVGSSVRNTEDEGVALGGAARLCVAVGARPGRQLLREALPPLCTAGGPWGWQCHSSLRLTSSTMCSPPPPGPYVLLSPLLCLIRAAAAVFGAHPPF